MNTSGETMTMDSMDVTTYADSINSNEFISDVSCSVSSCGVTAPSRELSGDSHHVATRSFIAGDKSLELSSRKSVPTFTSLDAQRKSPEWLTIDKLNFEELSLFGRDEELEVLREALGRLSSGIVDRQLILISGESGTGKTALADSLRSPTAKLNGLFVTGKFDFNNKNEPYSGIVRACLEICDHILTLKSENLGLFEKVSQLIQDGLGSELSLLIKFMPALNGVVDFRDEDSVVLLEGTSPEKAKNRFQFAFQRFIRIISEEFGPLVLVLDDLQWADGSSLDLVDACLSDVWIKKLMIIGTYRSNEVGQNHILDEVLARFRIKCDEELFAMANITVKNLDANATRRVIGVLLSMENDVRTRGLAQVCFKKTQGNPFFVLQFLFMLCDSGLLKYNYVTFSWNWNNDQVDSSTTATNNVVELLKVKMAYLPKHLLGILKIAACLGSTFDETCLRLIWENWPNLQLPGAGNDEDALISGLEYLEQDGYILRNWSRSSSQSYSWTHDNIQEAAMMLIPPEDRSRFLHDAGDILLCMLGTGALKSAIFVVANLLNQGEAPDPSDEKRMVVCRLNHDASLRALSISAFESVADYARKGIQLLPNDHWNDHYELSLGLYSIAAQAEGSLGNVDLMLQYCDMVLSQEERPMSDKLWVYRTMVHSLMARDHIEDAVDLTLNILAMGKCRFPKNPLLITAGLIKTAFKMKSMVKSVDPESLQKSNNLLISELAPFADNLVVCFYVKKDARLPLVVSRILDWTMKYGHCNYSSVAFAVTGLLLIGVLGDFRGGTWYGEQALKLMQKATSSSARCRTMMTVYGFVFVWTKPIPELFKPLTLAYNEGLKCGDQVIAAYSTFYLIILRYIIGNPLGDVERDIRLFSKQMKDWKLTLHMDFTKIIHQTILNLIGINENSSMEPVGEVFSEEDYRRCSQDCDVAAGMSPWEGALFTYFGNHVRQADAAILSGHDYLEKRYPCAPTIMFDTFLKGISCFAAAQETGKKKYSKMGQKLLSKIKRWHKLGNPNVSQYESFLDAEFYACRRKNIDAIRYYEISIRHAGRTGFLQDAAFASERLAEFQLEVMGDKKEAAYRLSQSLQYWRDWGAMAKVEALEKKYSHLFPDVIGVSTDTHS